MQAQTKKITKDQKKETIVCRAKKTRVGKAGKTWRATVVGKKNINSKGRNQPANMVGREPHQKKI